MLTILRQHEQMEERMEYHLSEYYKWERREYENQIQKPE
jgi:hypothetical protein